MGAKKYIKCNDCGRYGFMWAQIDGKWRLVRDGIVHSCRLANRLGNQRKSRSVFVTTPAFTVSDKINNLDTWSEYEDCTNE